MTRERARRWAAAQGAAAVAVALMPLLASCRSAPSGPYQPPSGLARNTARAEELSGRAAAILLEEPEKAEALLREALTADLFFGPAHNNLGVLYLKRGRLYEAASEFEWARKLMPGHPDPRLNLALALEAAGQTDEALLAYGAALEVYPGYVPAIQGLARLTVRAGRGDERLLSWLERIALEGESEAWQDWARRERARRE